MRFGSGFGVPNNHTCEAGLGVKGCTARRPATGADNSTPLAYEQALPHARFLEMSEEEGTRRGVPRHIFGTVALHWPGFALR